VVTPAEVTPNHHTEGPAVTTTQTPLPPEPVQVSERIEIVDVLRGVALLGILVVNMEVFVHPMQTLVLQAEPSARVLDQTMTWLVRFLAEGKFYTFFSFLFGLGFALQMMRLEQRGSQFAPVYVRRLLALFGIGLLHAFLIWVGDILTLYALMGFVLLLFRKAKPKTLLIWSCLLLIVPLVLNGAGAAALDAGRRYSPQVGTMIDRAIARQDSIFRAQAEQADSVYAGGDYAEITVQRARDMRFMAMGNLSVATSVLAMFLLGLYVGRRGMALHIDDAVPMLRKVFWWCLPIGLAGSGTYAVLIGDLSRTQPSWPLVLAMTGFSLGAPALMLAYVTGITLMWRRPPVRRICAPLAALGRVPLSAYLTQSIVCTLVFYGYGLGLFGRVEKTWQLALAVTLFGLQLAAAHWWVRRYRFGPAEWVWRSLTYMRKQPWLAEGGTRGDRL